MVFLKASSYPSSGVLNVRDFTDCSIIGNLEPQKKCPILEELKGRREPLSVY